MSPEDVRKLAGGYATGCLTSEERKALFEAALNDQDLFEELLREERLRELMDDPSARAELLAALSDSPAPRRSNWFWWIPAGAGVVAATALLAIYFGRSSPPEKSIEIARNQHVDATRPEPAPAVAPEPRAAAVPKPRRRTAVQASAGGGPAADERVLKAQPQAGLLDESAAKATSAEPPSEPGAPAAPAASPVPVPSAAPRAAMSVRSVVPALRLVPITTMPDSGGQITLRAESDTSGFLYLFRRDSVALKWTAVESVQGTPTQAGKPVTVGPIQVGSRAVELLLIETPDARTGVDPDHPGADARTAHLILGGPSVPVR